MDNKLFLFLFLFLFILSPPPHTHTDTRKQCRPSMEVWRYCKISLSTDCISKHTYKQRSVPAQYGSLAILPNALLYRLLFKIHIHKENSAGLVWKSGYTAKWHSLQTAHHFIGPPISPVFVNVGLELSGLTLVSSEPASVGLQQFELVPEVRPSGARVLLCPVVVALF